MWNVKGKWKANDNTLHYSYDQLPQDATERQKVQYVDNLLNTILTRSNSQGNYIDLRAEIADHYINSLGEHQLSELSGASFRRAIAVIHEQFGGASRVVEIAKAFEKERRSIVQRTFFRWFSRYWMIHVVMLILIIYTLSQLTTWTCYLIGSFIVVSIALGSTFSFLKQRNIYESTKGLDSSVAQYFNYKLSLISLVLFPVYFFNLEEDSTGYALMTRAILLCLPYVYLWIFYYHHTACSQLIAPILERYKTELI